MNTPTSKIGRLPRALREELNRRLSDGESGTQLLAWLNNHDGVRAALAAHFGGQPLNHSNLTVWKNGPFREWQIRRDLFDALQTAASDAAKLAGEIGPLIDHVAALLTARYAADLAAWDGDPASPAAERLRALSSLRRDIVALQRSSQIATRVHIEKAHFDEDLRKAEEKRREEEAHQARLEDPEYLRQRREFVETMMARFAPAQQPVPPSD